MGKVRSEISVLRQERLKQMYRDIQAKTGLSQAQFADRVDNLAASDFSKFMTSAKDLSEKMCRRIVEAFPEYDYQVAWLMGYTDIPTEHEVREVENYYRYIDRMRDESHVTCSKRNLLQIIRTKVLHDKDVSINATSKNEDFSDFVVSFGNEEPFSISATDFARLALDIEHYAIFRLKEYKNRGCI